MAATLQASQVPLHPLDQISWNDRVWTHAQAELLAENGYSPPNMLINHNVERGVILETLNQGVARWTGDSDGVTDRDHLVVAYRFPTGAFGAFAGARELIAEAMAEVGDVYMNGCIKWVDDTDTQAHNAYIEIGDDPNGGCVSNVGQLSSQPQMMNYNPGSGVGTDGCLHKSVITHEFLHAMGMNHEQERPDRDSHVIVETANIDPAKMHNYEMMPSADWMDMSSAYDYQSIMHYGATFFITAEAEAAGLFAMTDLSGNPVQAPRVDRMSSEDCFQLQKMYENFCPVLASRTCTSGHKYLRNRACDGTNDCADASDETEAICNEVCTSPQLFVSKNNCLTSETDNYLGTYNQMTETMVDGFPRAVKITITDPGAPSSIQGTFYKTDIICGLPDFGGFESFPVYKQPSAEQYIRRVQNSWWSFGDTACSLSMFMRYIDGDNPNSNFWEGGTFNYFNGEWLDTISGGVAVEVQSLGYQHESGTPFIYRKSDGQWVAADAIDSTGTETNLGDQACPQGTFSDILVNYEVADAVDCTATTTPAVITTTAPAATTTTVAVTTTTVAVTTTTVAVTTTTVAAETTTTLSIIDQVTGEWNVVAGDDTGNEVIVSITGEVVTVQTKDPATGELISFDTGTFDPVTGTISIGGKSGSLQDGQFVFDDGTIWGREGNVTTASAETTTAATTIVAADTTTVAEGTTTPASEETTTLAIETTTPMAEEETTTVAGETTTVAGETTTTVPITFVDSILGDWSITAGDATVPEDTTGNDVVVSLISGNDVNVVITDAAGAATTLTGTLNPVAMTITIQDGSVGSIQPDGSVLFDDGTTWGKAADATTATIATTTVSPYGAGSGSIKGDPHVRVKVSGQDAICYDVNGATLNYISLIYEPSTRLEINGKIDHVKASRSTKSRLTSIGVKTPSGVEIGVYSDAVTVGTNGLVENTLYYNNHFMFQSGGAQIEILTNADSRKQGVRIELDDGSKFHIAEKHGKESMELEILNSSGFTKLVSGVLGQSIRPKDYVINEDYSINVEDRFIATSSWDSDGHCRRIRDSDVEEYLGHSISYYAVENLFSDFSKTIKLELHEEKRPKK